MLRKLLLVDQRDATLDLSLAQRMKNRREVFQLALADLRLDVPHGNKVQHLLQVLNLPPVGEDVAQPFPSPGLHVDRVLGVEAADA